MTALASLAIADVESVEGYVAGYAPNVLPAIRGAGEGRTNGYAGSIAANIPAMQAGYSYGVVTPSGLYRVGTLGIADASGGIEFIVYPSQAAIGDFAILFLGWQTAPAGFFNVPEGWTSATAYLSGVPSGQLMYRVIESLEPFPITNNGTREGGGYMMNVYRRGGFQSAGNRNDTTTTTVDLTGVDPNNIGDISCTFVVSTGTPNTINSGSVTPPQVVINNLEGDSGAGQASIWTLDEILTSTGFQSQSAITPVYSTGSPSIEYAAFSAVIEEVNQRLYGSAACTIPAFTASASGFITFKGTIAQTLPAMVGDAEGLILRSGREVCLNTDESINRVEFGASINSVSFEPSVNRIVIEPLNPNRVC